MTAKLNTLVKGTDSDNVLLTSIKLFNSSKRVELTLRPERILSPYELLDIERRIIKEYSINDVCINLDYLLVEINNHIIHQYACYIIEQLSKDTALVRCLMAKSEWHLEGDRLKICLSHGGAELLNEKGFNKKIQALYQRQTGKQISVELYDKGQEHIEALRKQHEEQIEKSMVELMATKTEQASGQEVATESTFSQEDLEITQLIKGGKPKGDITAIASLNENSGKVVICGDVFSVEKKELRNGKTLIVFAVTDYTGSIKVKLFAGAKNDEQDETRKERLADRCEKLKSSIKEGVRVLLNGKAQYDEYMREVVIMGSGICEVQKEEKMDNAPVKRVELHAHTQMSAMDSVVSVTDLVKRAAKWGHPAIAITDHGVVQAYPDAFNVGKKNGIKIIYGVECYLQGSKVNVVFNDDGRTIDDEFVVFDIETTGLNPSSDRIIEIGAVKLKKGQIIDRFGMFVNPQINIPEKITELTSITNDDVRDAPTIEKAIEDFYAFAQGTALVAHNATFDTGFVRAAASRLSMPFEFCYLDTLELCRSLFPELKRHKLNLMVKHLGIELQHHHRAVDDAEATCELLKRCFDMLRAKELTRLSTYNTALAEGRKGSSNHAILLVKNKAGLQNLYRIISQAHLKHFYKRPIVPKELLEQYREGLIVGSACEAGELYQAILHGAPNAEVDRIANFYDYYELQPLGNNEFLINKGNVAGNNDLIEINKKIIALGEKMDKLVVATCDVHFLDPKDEVYRRILMRGQGFDDADNQAPLYFRTTDEMLEEFAYLGDKAHEIVVDNPIKIADMIDSIQILPDEPHPPKIDGVDDELVKISTEKAISIYGEPLPEIVKERMDRELGSIIKHGFAVMYIIAQKLVWKSLEDGYLVGSRGSVGSSFVAFLAGITEVNALQPHYVCPNCKHNEFITDGSVACGVDMEGKNCPNCGTLYNMDGYDIPFETFLGFDGDKEPDIDLNFSGEYQPNAHKYTEVLFGEGYVFRAGTIGTIADKTAYGYVKKYFDEKGQKVSACEIDRIVKGCTGVKRTTGQHPGGIMVVPKDEDIHWYCPVQHPADDTTSNIITTHFDYHSISGRLLKLDILGHDDPTVIRMLEDLTGLNARDIKIGDKPTMSIFTSTEALGVKPEEINSVVGTYGVPEFGTAFVRKMLVDTKPTTFAELVRISGLSHGTDVWLGNAQDLVNNGTATLKEVICTRDDIMTYLIYKGLPKKSSFKIMEDVRKGKGLRDEYVELMKENNVPEWYIDSCKRIKYMFPKAHAVAYVMMAFRIAWFKVHRPKEYYVAYLTVRADDFDATLMTGGKDKISEILKQYNEKEEISQKDKNVVTILEICNEMYARGIEFLPVNLYKSDAFKFIPMENGILPPLNSLAGLGNAAAESIVKTRQEGEFESIEDLRVRAKISKSVIEILNSNGCLKGMPQTAQMSLF